MRNNLYICNAKPQTKTTLTSHISGSNFGTHYNTHKLESIHGADIHYWYGTKEAFVAKPQAEHLLQLCPDAHVEVFPKMNHGQLLVDHPEEVAGRILGMKQ